METHKSYLSFTEKKAAKMRNNQNKLHESIEEIILMQIIPLMFEIRESLAGDNVTGRKIYEFSFGDTKIFGLHIIVDPLDTKEKGT